MRFLATNLAKRASLALCNQAAGASGTLTSSRVNPVNRSPALILALLPRANKQNTPSPITPSTVPVVPSVPSLEA